MTAAQASNTVRLGSFQNSRGWGAGPVVSRKFGGQSVCSFPEQSQLVDPPRGYRLPLLRADQMQILRQDD